MPFPTSALMCAPDHYQVLALRNAYLSGHTTTVDLPKAQRQWSELKQAFDAAGCAVSLIAPMPFQEDMVFCANQSLVGTRPDGEKVALMSAMRHSSHRREVEAFESWYKDKGYRIIKLKTGGHEIFEGSADAVWHPGKRLLWGGFGFRSEPEIFEQVAKAFHAPVILLKLVNQRFYHLDSCFCPLTPEAVLIHPAAFDASSLELILKMFPIVVTATEHDAVIKMACNSAIIRSRTAILQKGASAVANHMHALGLGVYEVDTSEFIKSGGSVYSMKQFLF
jgi:N-dimethylarginine dimethylaminohydrolase